MLGGRLIKSLIRRFGYDIVSAPHLIKKRTEAGNIEILLNPAFQASVSEVMNVTLLDTARLANLWQLCQMSNSSGAIIEVGSYKGGSALHLSNSCPERRIYLCDTFEGFGELPINSKLDRLFGRDQFADTSFSAVTDLFKSKGRDAVFVKGYFPESASKITLQNISFAHIDVDIYQSTLATLDFLLPRFMERSIIVFDDYLRNADGLMRAVREIEATHADWKSFPMYPGQGVMLHKSWFGL